MAIHFTEITFVGTFPVYWIDIVPDPSWGGRSAKDDQVSSAKSKNDRTLMNPKSILSEI